MRPRLRPVLLVSALCVGLVERAQAHAHLASAKPAMGAVLAEAPSILELDFTEAVNPRFSGATLTGPGGGVPLGLGTSGPGGGKALLIPVSGPLPAGAYRVEWHALATDGHKTAGSYAFTLAP